MSHVFVVDTNRTPLNPVHPGEARRLLSHGKAAVLKRYPFTIILKQAIITPQVTGLRVKVDPGSRTTGIAVVNDTSGQVVFAAELTHRGQAIKANLDARRRVRRSRRQRKTRYRKARWRNRRIKKGWLPPSLGSRLENICTWVRRLCQLCVVTASSMELVRFDMQRMENPDIAGVEYQQGTLMGYEVREYLLEKWGRQCAYCGVKDVPLEIEHIHSRAHGGTNRIANLTVACVPCNRAKGNRDITNFLHQKPEVLARILTQAKHPLKDAAAVNTTRWALLDRLTATGLPVETGSGGVTKFNRTQREIPKTHWSDAACVGASTPPVLKTTGVVPLLIRATGHGSRQMCLMSAYGFPRTAAKGARRVQGFQTGDLVKAVVPTGKKQGTYWGRVAVRSSGSFNIKTSTATIQGISYRHCQMLQRSDGYTYTTGGALPPHA
ncbi:RNA-guided endonuclease IscB [Dictyobacter aurantiacus]|uniref:HNH nuclease domain-containing protein n=1 Tax=Dictyobacter aurantiacus TaxID=1936993 RepID=A0A401ZBA7_9CHLR|nr:RNA-guided endonuclease IscB [Dictyobacter aurantiacus]GCE04008.1 hypothetical protein KDAU_13370 [Dictyobacter aurantiacus]